MQIIKKIDYTLPRGDTRKISFVFKDSAGTSLSIVGAKIYFTVKKSISDADSDAEIQIITSVHADAEHGESYFIVTHNHTKDIEPGKYIYDVQLCDAVGNITTLLYGNFTISWDITNDIPSSFTGDEGIINEDSYEIIIYDTTIEVTSNLTSVTMAEIVFTEHINDTDIHTSTEEKADWNSKADGDHNHTGVYESADSTILKQANIVNNLTSTSTTAPLSAAQGKVLQDGKAESNHDHSYTNLDDKPDLSSLHSHSNKTTLDAIPSHSTATTGQVIAKNSEGGLSFIDQTEGTGNGEDNVQADWNQTDNTQDDYIKNKPSIPTALSSLSDDATHRLVTDTEKTTWNGKQAAGSYELNTNKENSTIDTSTTKYPTVNLLKTGLDGKQNTGSYELSTNKVTSISVSSTDTQYPTAKLLYDQLALKQAAGSYETADSTILKQANIVNNLTSTSTTAPLSAAQGKALQDGKQASGSYETADATILKQANIVNNLTSTSTTAPLSAAQGKALQDGKQASLGYTAESTSNKVTSISVSSTDTQYPTAKLLYDQLAAKQASLTLANFPFWFDLAGTYASTSTFTYTCLNATSADNEVKKHIGSLFTCTTSDGSTRKYGYIKSVSRATTTMTVTVVTNANLASGDKDFKVTINRKITDYKLTVTIPGEVVGDANNQQGLWLGNIKYDSILLPVDSSLLTAASGTGAACIWNVYKNTTALFSSGQDLTTNTTYVERRPTTATITAGENISVRATSVGGATTKPQNLQITLYIVPTHEFGAAL